MVPPPRGCGCGRPPPLVGVGVFGAAFENEKLRFDCAGASGSRVNVHKSHQSLTETFSQHPKGKERISLETVVARGPLVFPPSSFLFSCFLFVYLPCSVLHCSAMHDIT